MKKTIALCGLMLFGKTLFAQSDEEMTNAVEFLQGGFMMEGWFMEFLRGWKVALEHEYGEYILFAKVLGGGFCLLYFAIKSYEMMTGDKKLEIMPLLRPFGLCMVIVNWTAFVSMIEAPIDLMARSASDKYLAREQIINNYRVERAKLQFQLNEQMFNLEAETELAAKQSTAFLDDPLAWTSEQLSEMGESVVRPLITLKNKMVVGMELFISQALETVSLWVLRLGIYLLFSLQIIYSSILAILGPISVAMSIHPAFKDNFTSWVSRFIAANLYVLIGFIVLITVSILQEHALRSEISRYREIIDQTGEIISMEKLMWLRGGGIISFGSVIIAFVLSAVSLSTVPSISTWVVSTSGISSAVSTFGRQGGRMAGMLRGAIMKI